MRIWSLQGGRVTVTKDCSVKTPRVVTVASTTRTLCEASAEMLRLKWHDGEARGRSTVSELRERIHGGDFAGVSRKRMSFAFFCPVRLSRNTCNYLLQEDTDDETSRSSSHLAHHDECLMRVVARMWAGASVCQWILHGISCLIS